MSDIHQLSVKRVHGIGDKRSDVLKQVGIHTIADLLGFLPFRYLDRSTETPLSKLPTDQEVTGVGQVVASNFVPGRRQRFVATVKDESGKLDCVWFAGYKYVKDAFQLGDWVSLGGKVMAFRGKRQMVHPEVEVLSGSDEEDDRIHTGGIVPLYRTTAKMKASYLTARTLRRLIRGALDELEIDDPLDQDLRSGLVGLSEAYSGIHFPDSLEDVESGRRRLAFDELLTIRASGLLQCPHGHPLIVEEEGERARALEAHLPFVLTDAQKRSLEEIRMEMRSDRTLHRLLQGDVGSGKTLVALLAGLSVVDCGAQVALMVPTEVLAEQHMSTIKRLVEPLGLRAELMTGRFRKAEREAAAALVASGQTHIVIGTHALLEEDVRFKHLGLVIVDEQHRFGVAQRLKLRKKGKDAHLLVMTATPIPRSLALTLYGHLEVSTIDELPSGRKPIKTGLRFGKDREKAFAFIRDEVARGRQAYIVYPTVEGTKATQVKSAKDAFEELQVGALKGLRIGLIYGSMKSVDKSATMESFRSGEIDVLVSTTVIEVGVDVANATVMMIEHAERFGLSQLHQLRGRVGRSEEVSYCILVADPKEGLTDEASARLKAMCKTNDGFEISEVDLEIRGSGQMCGTRQAGLPEFRYANLTQDQDLIARSREAGDQLMEADPNLTSHRWLKDRILALSDSGLLIAEAG
ncbi:MAG: ATP-dependent DNA helicase RecG [Candidatus Latescibacterota bacterium]|nr:ATP-dependent DNA helicase RecG [Candidatus Latescibacterota bacterium]